MSNLFQLEIHVAVTKLATQQKEKILRKLKSEKVEMDYNVICVYCEKSIDSAFVKFKDGRLAHYSCHSRQSIPQSPAPPNGGSGSGDKRLNQRHRTVSLL